MPDPSPAPHADDIETLEIRNDVMRLEVLTLGAITKSWAYLGNDGVRPLVLGYGQAADYLTDPYYLGAIVGRVANRMRGAAFDLGGQHHQLPANEGGNLLHGGAEGLHRQLWQVAEAGGTSLTLTHHSPDGAGGFPGAVDFSVRIALDGARLIYEMEAQVDRPTPISLAQHNYYNLTGAPQISDHRLSVSATRYQGVKDGLATGDLLPVSDSRHDLRQARSLAALDPEGLGYDVSLLPEGQGLRAVATLAAPDGLNVTLHSDQPALQFYSGAGLGAPFQPMQGLCLEPQGLIDAVNIPAFPSVIATPDAPYRQMLILEVSTS